MTCITCTDKGRILLAGRDGHIYELHYNTGLGWHMHCHKVCLTSGLGSVISSWNFQHVPPSEMLNFTSKLLADSRVQPHRDALKMPALILDRKEKMASHYICSNGLVEGPCAIESERTLVPMSSDLSKKPKQRSIT